MPRKPHACRVAAEATRVCAGAMQNMFQYASSFNQPVAAWDVGQVTAMQVRYRPRHGREGLGGSCEPSCAHNC